MINKKRASPVVSTKPLSQLMVKDSLSLRITSLDYGIPDI